MLETAISLKGVILLAALTAYDTQRLESIRLERVQSEGDFGQGADWGADVIPRLHQSVPGDATIHQGLTRMMPASYGANVR
jgi:FtsH-binding integral membrane protein